MRGLDMNKKPYLIDIAVLVIFFKRSGCLEKVFQEIKKARPSRLYLHQDGPRLGKNDEEGIKRCRAIFDEENIDWECDIYRYYRDENLGCDPAEYLSQKWFFENEKMGIVLEDDDVPSQSFFLFAKELLEKYQNDLRVSIICGSNAMGITNNTEDSYFFTKVGAIWGWASWRRFFELEDPNYEWLQDSSKIEHIRKQLSKKHFDDFIKAAIKHKKTGKAYYETTYQAAQYLSDGYAIVPKYNMIKNLGVSEGAVHNASDIKLLARNTQKIFKRDKYEIQFPLCHPSNLTRNRYYEKKVVQGKIPYYWSRLEHAIRVLWFKGPREFFLKAIRKVKH